MLRVLVLILLVTIFAVFGTEILSPFVVVLSVLSSDVWRISA